MPYDRNTNTCMFIRQFAYLTFHSTLEIYVYFETRIEAAKAYKQYVEEPKTNQRRRRFDLELELDIDRIYDKIGDCFD